jgi:hypothetical protein
MKDLEADAAHQKLLALDQLHGRQFAENLYTQARFGCPIPQPDGFSLYLAEANIDLRLLRVVAGKHQKSYLPIAQPTHKGAYLKHC